MNKITLQAYTQGIESTNASDYGQDMDKVALDRIYDDPVVHYCAFDYLGIDLHDRDLVYASEADNIGFVSTVTQGEVPEAKRYLADYGVEINLADNYDLTKTGLTIWYHDEASAWFMPFIWVWGGEYDSQGKKRLYFLYGREQKAAGRRHFVAPEYFTEWVESYPTKQIKSLIITGSYMDMPIYQHPTEMPNLNRPDTMFLQKIDGITWGFDTDAAEIQGDISVYAEIDETKTDTPAGSCDLVAVFDDFADPDAWMDAVHVEPEEGMRFTLETEHIKGRYTITSVTRQGENIYSIQATDDIENTGAFILNATEGHMTYTDPKMFTKGTTTSWNDDTLGSISVKGWVNVGETNRQALAHFSAAANRWISAFNDPVGIHTITEQRSNELITADRILGTAEYKRNYPYKGVEISQELNGIVYVTQVASKTPQNNSKGWFKLDNFGMRPTEDALKNMVIMAGNILRFLNGNEVTATIIYDGEQLGEIVTIETPYNGNITGLIKSLDFTIGINSTIATVTIKEVAE